MLQEAIDGRIELLLPELVSAELERVLTRKLGFGEEQARAARALLAQVATDEPAPAHLVEARADRLVTGDRKHLLPIGVQRGVRLVTPQALLAELREVG